MQQPELNEDYCRGVWDTLHVLCNHVNSTEVDSWSRAELYGYLMLLKPHGIFKAEHPDALSYRDRPSMTDEEAKRRSKEVFFEQIMREPSASLSHLLSSMTLNHEQQRAVSAELRRRFDSKMTRRSNVEV